MARKERKHHYIYKITCKVTQRYYIGMHSTDNLDDGYFGSGKRLWFSINYHGKENHEKEILEFCSSREELKKREKEIVNEELLREDLCMNLVIGGEGGYISIEGVKKGRKITDEKYYDKLNIWRSKGGIKNFEKNGNNLENNICNWKGRKHSNETKKLMSKSSKGIGVGQTNSQYGTCWITRNGENKKIKKEDLDSYISDGWIKGRK